jgi:hypothetical protein
MDAARVAFFYAAGTGSSKVVPVGPPETSSDQPLLDECSGRPVPAGAAIGRIGPLIHRPL